MKAKSIKEQLEFNLKPRGTIHQFKSQTRHPLVGENPRKGKYGLNSDEEEIEQRHETRIRELEEEIETYQYEIEDLQSGIEIDEVDPGEVEQFSADIQNQLGFDALDILNSGISREEKKKAIREMLPLANDTGKDEEDDILGNYEYYYPSGPDESEIEEVQKKIEKIKTQMKERKNTIDKLESKIYNLRTY